MKKFICIMITLVIVIGIVPFFAHGQGRSYSWYCVHAKDNKQPVCDPTMNFISRYGGYYIDKKHGDDCSEKVVYLTFDAGYENGNISKILDIMKEENVKGAFFVLSHLVDKESDLVCRMLNEGHTVANHTSRHKDMSSFDNDAFSAELASLEKLFYEKTGQNIAKYYRPPEGKFSENNLKTASELGYKTIFWSFAYADWDENHQMSKEAAEKKILSNIHNGAVLLLHPTSTTNVLVLKDVIKKLKDDGYRFGTLDELTENTQKASASANVYHKNCNGEMNIALTFDDGPHPKKTPKILDLLAKHGIHATFFMIGQNVEYYSQAAKRVVSEGHEIGNHTYSHPHIGKSQKSVLLGEMTECASSMERILGRIPRLFRPPEGVVDDDIKAAAFDMGYNVILWSVDTRDWAGASAENIAKNVLSNVHPGDIILMHDYTGSNCHTLEALEIMIPQLLEKGYNFVTVSELISK